MQFAMDTEGIIQALRSHAPERKIDMDGFRAEPLNCVRLALAVAGNTRLLSLELVCGDRILGRALAEALKANTVLQSFTLTAGQTQIGDETGRALAEALKENAVLQSFTLTAGQTQIGDETGRTLAEALKENAVLQSFTLTAGRTQIGDETGRALAEALKENAVLQSFTLDAGLTPIGDETGRALAEALKANNVLQSFTLNARLTQIGDETGCALAEALKANTVLQSFTLKARLTQIGDETGRALAEALKANVVLQSFTFAAYRIFLDVSEWLARNREVFAQWRNLAAIARVSDDFGIDSLVPNGFRSAVFAFSLPSSCRVAPRWMSATGWVRSSASPPPVALAAAPLVPENAP